MVLSDRHIIGSWEINAKSFIDCEFLGGKAEGLLMIPKQWTLPFIMLTKNFYDLWIIKKNVLGIIENLAQEDKETFEHFLNVIVPLRAQVFIRSNSPHEDLSKRGTYHSIAVNNELANIVNGINDILTSSLPDPMYIILQTCISPGLTGHMSNERRITATPNKWLVEQQDGYSQGFIIANKGIFNTELFARKEKDLFSSLRKVAGTLISLDKNNTRYHCEWVWNGYRVWIVQVDKSMIAETKDSATLLIESKDKSVPSEKSFSILTHFKNANSENWKKLRSPLEFQKIGIPYSDVFLLTGDQWNDENEDVQNKIKDDLYSICVDHPVVVRCDIAKNIEMEDLLLPTSGVLKRLEDIISYMSDINSHFDKMGLSKTNWTFLISYLYSVKASALIHSFPNAQRIRVDALWGFPDGLLYYPHETWYYYPEVNKSKLINNFKSVCLFPTNSGWKPYDIVQPYDWQSVLNKAEVQILSLWALRLANSVGKEVQLMAFTKLGERQGSKGCLPWHYTNLPIPQYTDSLKVLPSLSQILVVKSWNELDTLCNMQSKFIIKGLLIMPSADMLRNDEFLTETAKFAAKNKLPLYFQGSLLGHAYYIMSKTGAKVIPITPDEPKDSKIRYNKLVRDKIPIIIKQAGGLARIRKLDKSEAITLLSQKIIEEAFEVWNSKSPQELLNEIADVIEVIEALIKFSGFNKDELDEIKQNKIAKRGGFEELCFLEETAIRPLKSIDNTEGILPLFLEDDNMPKAKKEKTKKMINFMSEINWDDQVHFSVPLVPQIDNNLKLKTLEENNGEYYISINYEGNRLNIQVRKLKSKTLSNLPKAHEEGFQLSLF